MRYPPYTSFSRSDMLHVFFGLFKSVSGHLTFSSAHAFWWGWCSGFGAIGLGCFWMWPGDMANLNNRRPKVTVGVWKGAKKLGYLKFLHNRELPLVWVWFGTCPPVRNSWKSLMASECEGGGVQFKVSKYYAFLRCLIDGFPSIILSSSVYLNLEPQNGYTMSRYS